MIINLNQAKEFRLKNILKVSVTTLFLLIFMSINGYGQTMVKQTQVQSAVKISSTAGGVIDGIKVIHTCATRTSAECSKSIAKTAVTTAATTVAMPTAIAITSVSGVAAGTGTAISTLSGAAAVSATSAYVGSSVIAASGGVLATVAAPAVIGGAVILGIGAGVGWAFSKLFD